MSKITISFDGGIKVELEADCRQTLAAISVLTNIAHKEMNLPKSALIAAFMVGFDERLNNSGEILEQLSDDTAISKEFADILRGLKE